MSNSRNEKLNERLDSNVGIFKVTFSVPLWIDKVLGKPLEEITEDEWDNWEEYISQEEFKYDDHEVGGLFIEYDTYKFKEIMKFMKDQHCRWDPK